MRAAALLVWIFINLVCFGMCGYMYLIWTQYWLHMERQRLLREPEIESSTGAVPNPAPPPQGLRPARSAVGALSANRRPIPSARPTSSGPVESSGRPRFPGAQAPLLEFDTGKFACDEPEDVECRGLTDRFRELVVKEFHRVLLAESDAFKADAYGVRFNATVYRERSRRELLCALRSVAVRTVGARDEPFAEQGFPVPRAPPLSRRLYRTCAVVTSAGALYGSGLGAFIDSHDMVLRFNNAPTDNFTDDVGARTTLRVLNSQVVSKPEFSFLTSPLYRGVALLAWDPSHYSATLRDWYRRPDFPLFGVYKRFMDEHPAADAHILHPAALWALWDFLQTNSPYRLRKNPPSSGFIGLWFALWRCARVRMFEFVPSTRATRRCHYYAARADAACTLGAWHPLAQEKALAERLRDNTDTEVFQKGYIDVPGLETLSC